MCPPRNGGTNKTITTPLWKMNFGLQETPYAPLKAHTI
jgi:hypothetical protein